MRNYFTLDGVDSRNYGVYISGQGTFNSPARNIDFIEIPGKNGDLIGLSTRLENGEYRYNNAFIYTNFHSNIEAFKAFLLSVPGYRKLVDTYHPNEYRMVAYRGRLEVNPTSKNDAGQFDIIFVCKPQIFLASGDMVTTLTADGTITNPTAFASKPLLRVYGAGTLSINGIEIAISNADVYTDIDIESGYAYKGTTSKNNYVSTPNSLDFPELVSGSNAIVLGEGISQVDITPRWWKL